MDADHAQHRGSVRDGLKQRVERVLVFALFREGGVWVYLLL